MKDASDRLMAASTPKPYSNYEGPDITMQTARLLGNSEGPGPSPAETFATGALSVP